MDTQPFVFPDHGTEGWAAATPEQANLKSRALEAAASYAHAHRSSALVILSGGRIVLERYWPEAPLRPLHDGDPTVLAFEQTWRRAPDATGRPLEDIASAQKSVVAVLLAIAVERGLLEWSTPVAAYLGKVGLSHQKPSLRSRCATSRQ